MHNEKLNKAVKPIRKQTAFEEKDDKRGNYTLPPMISLKTNSLVVRIQIQNPLCVFDSSKNK